MAKWSKSEKSWERQPKESAQAYEAFDLYLKMGRDRSCHKVARELSKSDTIIKRWSSTWSWQKRVRDYDAELRRAEFEAEKKAVKEMHERQINLSVLLQKKAFEALKKLDISELKPQEILRFISEGAKLETANRAETTQQIAAEAGEGQQATSLADAIIEAYQRRKEAGDGV